MKGEGKEVLGGGSGLRGRVRRGRERRPLLWRRGNRDGGRGLPRRAERHRHQDQGRRGGCPGPSYPSKKSPFFSFLLPSLLPCSDSEQQQPQCRHRDAERELEALLAHREEDLGHRSARPEIDLAGDALEVGPERGDGRVRPAGLRGEAAQERRIGFREDGLPARVRLVAARAARRVHLGDGRPRARRGADEHGVNRDSLRLGAADRPFHAALEVFPVREEDEVAAASDARRKELGGRRDSGRDGRAGLGAHAGLDRVEEETHRRRVQRERDERLGVSLARDERDAVAPEPCDERLRGLAGEREPGGRHVGRPHRSGGVEDEDDVGPAPLGALLRVAPVGPRERGTERERDEDGEGRRGSRGRRGRREPRLGGQLRRDECGRPRGAAAGGPDEEEADGNGRPRTREEGERRGEEREEAAERVHRGATGKRRRAARAESARQSAAGRATAGKTSRKRV